MFEHGPPPSELAAQLLSNGTGVRLTVRGSSMAPTLRDGDVAELVAVDPRQVRRGDIVLLPRAEGGYMLHRVVRSVRDGTWIQTRGDANWKLDSAIPRSAVLGRLRGADRGARRPLQPRRVVDALRASIMLASSALRYRLPARRPPTTSTLD